MWTIDEVADQSGRTAVVTGANVGVGFETARALAARGATVILACRDVAKGEAAAERITAASAAPPAGVRVVRLDLASLASVRAAADDIRASVPRLDLLINNAGVMDIPFARSEDGVELTFAVNHLGHFALTGLLLAQLLATPGSRVVTVSSVAHRRGLLDLETLESEEGYKPGDAYARSKLANLLFAYELQGRLDAAGAGTISLAAHPGIARTELYRTNSRFERALLSSRVRALTSWLAQSAEAGASAHPARRPRPRRPRRRVLRAERLEGVRRPTGACRLDPELTRRLGPTAPVAGVGGAERDHVSPPARVRKASGPPSERPRRLFRWVAGRTRECRWS